MFTVVNDIAAYPTFLPWCGATRILSQTTNEICAEITIAKGPVRMAFSTRNSISTPSRIQIMLLNGPFKQLSGSWHFEARGDQACQVSLTMTFEFNNRLLTMTIGPVFEQIVNSLVSAFKQRADELYRTPQSISP
jgi:ribosome-associated toxin RatA of RatAB toxin-antitoxin module